MTRPGNDPLNTMRLSHAILALLICVLTGPASAQRDTPANNSGASIDPTYWPNDVFVIPYQWSSRTDPTTADKVILYLSRDRGANWSEVTRASPDVSSFVYHAAGDGELWFAVRTLDKSGRLWPSGGYAPELSVIVDTTIPAIGPITSSLDTAGRLRVRCEIRDANLDPAKVQLFARRSGDLQRIPVPLTTDGASTPGVVRAVAAWQAPAGADELVLELAAKDRAGNPAKASTHVRATPVVASGPTASGHWARQRSAAQQFSHRPISNQPIVGQQRATMFAPPTLTGQSGPQDPFLAAPPLELPNAGRWVSNPTPNPAPPQTSNNQQAWPADATAAVPFRASDPHAWSSVTTSSPDRVARPLGPSLDRSPYHSASASRGAIDSSGFSSGGPRATGGELLFVNGPRFALDYDLQSTGAWGVSKVEVWGTTDGGQTWRNYAEDSDNRSPVNISTPGPGRYGFRILVHGVGSLPPEAPKPGDRPEVEVEVDTQKPAAQITSVGQGDGYLGDHLIIGWRADDASLEARPISLFYSGSAAGPWVPIASNLENSGRYEWRLQRHLPTALLIRMEARDRAGNVTVLTTPRPVALNLAQPAATFRSARPIGG